MRLTLSKENLRLVRDSAVLVNASLITGFLYLLVHPILGRSMDKVDYAGFVQLMGLLAVLGVPSNATRVAISRYVAEFAQGRQVELWVAVVRRALWRLTMWGGLALVLWLLATGPLQRALHAPSRVSVAILGITAFISLYSPVVQGTLQGAMRFQWFSFAILSAALRRVLFAGATAMAGGTIDLVLGGVALSMLAGVLVGAWPFRRILRETPVIPSFDTAPIYHYLWPVLAGQTAVFLLVNTDLILSARFLPDEALAAYGKASTLSRTVLFLSQPIALAMFPRAVNSPRLRVLLGPLSFAFLISLAGAVALTLYPSLPMRLMYRVVDAHYDHLTRLYVWAALPHAMVMFIAQYLWARHQTKRVLLLLPVLALYLAALWCWHDSAETIIGVLTAAGWVSLAIMAGAAAWRTKEAS
jgi:O-antigen/teichoic acid export membrane protein